MELSNAGSTHRGNQLTRGRKFSAPELHLMLLFLLAQRPSHGYELVKDFSRLSNGYYSPSPGALYPALAYLEAAGQTTVELVGKRKRYQLSEAGRVYLGLHQDRVDLLFAILKHAAKKMVWMTEAINGDEAAAQATGWLPEFVEARSALKQALLRRSLADHDEQRRLSSILRNAVSQILQNVPINTGKSS